MTDLARTYGVVNKTIYNWRNVLIKDELMYHNIKMLVLQVRKYMRMALKNRKYPNRKLIHHSDRGLQFCNPAYTEILTQNNIKISMTTKYDPYENAIAERVNGILKDEFKISSIKAHENEVHRIVTNSINIYNKMRPHFSCQLMTPEAAHVNGNFKYKKWGKYSITEYWN